MKGMLSACVALGGVMLLAGCERPPVETKQIGYRGTAMEQVINPRIDAKVRAANSSVPVALPPASSDGPKASEAYKNVQVLGNLSVGEFTRLMVSISTWVSPEQQCTYCHKPGEDFAADTLYTKVVARKMLQMTQTVNSQYKSHVGDTGVTCYTCHRGKPVPSRIWFTAQPQDMKSNFIGDLAGQNQPAASVKLASLPYDPFTEYFLRGEQIRVYGTQPLPYGNRQSIKQAEFTYALMMHMSDSLGVNCTFCHNTQAFGKWEGSTPQRVTAWHGIRMVRDINVKYMEPLTKVFPAASLGPTGDVPKAYCATCHQGVNKPLYGAPMLKDYPELAAPAPTQAAIQGLLAKVLFAVGRVDLDADARAALGQVASALKENPAVKVNISGFADRTGQSAKNLVLARDRAFAVRDALQAAGVPAAQLILQRPEFVIGGSEADARRVDVKVAS